jgi:hypothetical protein
LPVPLSPAKSALVPDARESLAENPHFS